LTRRRHHEQNFSCPTSLHSRNNELGFAVGAED
jgi:hypothetical protein